MSAWSDAVAWAQQRVGRFIFDTMVLGAQFRNVVSPTVRIEVFLGDNDDPTVVLRPYIQWANGAWTISGDGVNDQLADPWLYSTSIKLIAASATEWDIFEADGVTALGLDALSMHLWLGLPQIPGADFTLTNSGTRIAFTYTPSTGTGAPTPYCHMAKRANHP